MIKTAFLFPGQGSQYIGMGKKLYEKYDIARKVFEEADEILGFSMTDLIFSGNMVDLTRTVHAQPAILTVSVAMFRVLLDKGIVPNILVGHSLGEITALTCANSISFKDALILARKRGDLMEQAVAQGEGTMAAVNTRDVEMLATLCSTIKKETGKTVSIANYNSHTQQVISGDSMAVNKVLEQLDKKDVKSKLLNVSGPFHCELMKPAAKEFAKVLKHYTFKDPKYVIVSNVDAKAYTNASEIEDKLVRQIYTPVQWSESMTYLKKAMVAYCIEVGPGYTLKNLMKTNVSDLTILSFDSQEDEIYSYVENSYYPFVSRAMGMAVATKNNNFDDAAYQEGVVKPYEQMQKIQTRIENQERKATTEEIKKALDLLITIFQTKGTDVDEQRNRIGELFSDSGQKELFKTFSLDVLQWENMNE